MSNKSAMGEFHYTIKTTNTSNTNAFGAWQYPPTSAPYVGGGYPAPIVNPVPYSPPQQYTVGGWNETVTLCATHNVTKTYVRDDGVVIGICAECATQMELNIPSFLLTLQKMEMALADFHDEKFGSVIKLLCEARFEIDDLEKLLAQIHDLYALIGGGLAEELNPA